MGSMTKEQFVMKFMRDTNMTKNKVFFSVDQRETIIERYRRGNSLRSLSKEYSCSRDTLTRRLKEWGVYSP